MAKISLMEVLVFLLMEIGGNTENHMEYTINSPLELILSRAANCCGTWPPETSSRILKVYSTLSDMSRHLRVTPTLF